MAQVFASPGRYIQGYGEIENLSKYTNGIGKTFLVVASKTGMLRIKGLIEKAYNGTSNKVYFEDFNGECTKKEAERLTKIAKDYSCDAVIGVGGGKVIDTAKAVAYYAGANTVIVPTAASSDAPTSALSVFYDEAGVLDEVIIFERNPDIVLMDTKMIAEAPARLLVAGMGDALATYYEARGCVEGYKDNFVNGKFTESSYALARLCYDILINNGVLALKAVEKNKVTKAVNNVIEANTLLSGIGFESNGVTGAHSVYYGFTVLEEHHHMYHGEFVAFGTIVLLILENRPKKEIDEVVTFCISVGLPVTFEDLKLKNITMEQLEKVAEKATLPVETIHNEPFKIDKDELIGALLTADSIGKMYKQKIGLLY